MKNPIPKKAKRALVCQIITKVKIRQIPATILKSQKRQLFWENFGRIIYENCFEKRYFGKI